MRVTVFTSNQPRHTALIAALAEVADTVYAVRECNTVFPGRVADFFRKSDTMQRYFAHVMDAEARVFGRPRFTPANSVDLPIKMGDLNDLPLGVLAPALESDAYIIFGASYIKGPLADYLVEHQAMNLHMGASPYYRGSSTNFWALYDDRPDYVCATVHLLTHGLDSGPLLYHAFPPTDATDPWTLGMRAVAAGQQSLVDRLRSGELQRIRPVPQDKSRQYRYTRNRDFTDAIAEEYLARLRSPAWIHDRLAHRDLSRFENPYIATSSNQKTAEIVASGA